MNQESPTRASRVSVQFFVAFVSALGLACIGAGMIPWRHTDLIQFICYLVLTAVASGLKVVIPGYEATLSVGFILFIVSIGSMSLSETLALGITAALVQCFWKANQQFSLVRFVFNLSQVSIALTGAYWVNAFLAHGPLNGRALIAVLLSSAVYFFLNSLPVAIVVSLSERTTLVKKWRDTFGWTLPFYLVGAAIAGLIQFLNRHAGWEITVVMMPALYLIYRSYSVYIGRMADMRAHLEEMAALHLRTIEALALAIDAKDHTTGDHVHRVRIYALELARDLNLSESEVEALRAAAVLHDIGKLAVPEHIISKPGKLTPEEFEKMKIHPIVGAEILDQVEFPYPVVPIVRSHHERWDGSGYPDGLSGEAIPIGARILSAVDCLDALASDRQYRRALPLDEAMGRVEQESGKTFDPKVVAALKARYLELEKLARSQQIMEKPQLSVNIKVAPQAAPAAGYAESEAAAGHEETEQAPARVTASLIKESPAKAMGDQALPAIAMRLRRHIIFDAVAVFQLRGHQLVPEFAFGEDCEKLLSLNVQSGEGLLGWVSRTRRPIRNGNPAVDIAGNTSLRSAMVVPLEYDKEVAGLLALYSTRPEAFTADDMRTIERFQQEILHLLNPPAGNGITVNECRALRSEKRLNTTPPQIICEVS
jgi:putative nucleotidyltransferase with HDIG domain